MHSKLLYILHSGKNSKFKYYFCAYLRQLIPGRLSRSLRKTYLSRLASDKDYAYMEKRIRYYCQLKQPVVLTDDSLRLGDFRIPKKQKVYYFDAQQYTRFFAPNLRWQIVPGDNIIDPIVPSIVKSRPLQTNPSNGVILNLDKVRHFIFVKDNLCFNQKLPKAIFRGKVEGKKEREYFMELYFGSPICDCGEVSRHGREEWKTPKMTIREHLKYRYIMCLEGNDVASNLKWVMSSHSIAVMPRPTCETWFMEGTLVPNYHYIEIQSDFSDLEEKITYYNEHPEKAEAIITHANEYVSQFQDKQREHLISIGVLDQYLRMTNANYE